MPNQWKPKQLEAINWPGGELIVSASAGTGKTSVIIERAWQLVLGRKANVDDLLIVTFTEDAAEQLKTRFRSRLDQETDTAESRDQRLFLRDQLHHLEKAQISTIHSFCRRVVHENYYRLGIGADVEILAPEQAVLLKHHLLDQLFEECYADETEFGNRFRALVNRYGGRRVDENLTSATLAIHAFLGSLANPEAWLARVRELIAGLRTDNFDLSSLPAWDYLKNHWLTVLDTVAAQFQNAGRQVAQHGHPKLQEYLNTLLDKTFVRRKFLAENRLEKLLANSDEKLPSSPPIRNEDDKLWWTPLKNDVDDAKESLKKIAEECLIVLAPEGKDILKAQTDFLETLTSLVETFSLRLTEAKGRHGHLEFDDLQRLALTILTGDGCETYRSRFKYILVDEYQDINELQNTIIRALGRPEENFPGRVKNVFMVGDVKQSIYRFRLAEPKIFQNLYLTADPAGKTGLGRINLVDNFRSRAQVLDAVNTVFTAILRGGILELQYDDQSRLSCAARYPETQNKQTAELHILERQIEPDPEENTEESEFAEMEAAEREAFFTARRIRELLDNKFQITQKDATRPAVAEDIVILLRSLKKVAGPYISMLRRMGISAYCGQIEAFLEYPEIADIVALLKIIDNPYQDIPLTSVLRSPLVGADLGELAKIRLTDKLHLFDGLEKWVTGNPHDPAVEKFKTFLQQYRHWHRTAACAGVAELVQDIYLDTNYPDYVRAAMPGDYGSENLKQFLHLAWQFSADGRSTLSDFLAYLDLLAEENTPISGVHSGGGKGVRIQTVHGSKGLEFPIVVIANAGKKINFSDLRRDILFDGNLLLGLKDIDPVTLEKRETLPSLALAKLSRNKTIAEELRLLYVAMTRAKEKLILVGSAKLVALAKNLRQINPNQPLTPAQVAGWTTGLDWIAAAIAHAPDGLDRLTKLLAGPDPATVQSGPFEISVYPSAAQTKWSVDSRFFGKISPDIADRLMALIQEKPKTPPVDPQIEKIINQADWVYPHLALTTMVPSVSVTDLVNLADDYGSDHTFKNIARYLDQADSFAVPDDPATSAVEKGRTWHTILEHLDLNFKNPIEQQIKSMVERRLITQAQTKFIEMEHLINFFRSEPGKIMLENKNTLHRELRFTFALPAKDFPEKVRQNESAEPVLVQGVLDCLVQTPKGFIIIDYKTNRITAGDVDRTAQHYKLQLEIYARAVGEILTQPITAAWLYFTEPNSAVQVL
jgi:ATP-dependent helicase/nuclease subunit A